MVCVQVVSCCMDVCTECQLLYGCVYRMSGIVWMCVQGVSSSPTGGLAASWLYTSAHAQFT